MSDAKTVRLWALCTAPHQGAQCTECNSWIPQGYLVGNASDLRSEWLCLSCIARYVRSREAEMASDKVRERSGPAARKKAVVGDTWIFETEPQSAMSGSGLSGQVPTEPLETT